MAVQFSLSYDANGDPVLVENTVTGTRKVVSTSPVVSEYKSRFETPADDGESAIPEQPDQEKGNDIYRYINEMEKGADADPNLSFIQKQNLERYTSESIEARSKEKSPTQKVIETVMRAVIPYADAATAAVKALSAILPEESEEIKAIKQFYADPEQAALVESIPGMSDYNLVYGNPFDPSYGLANAAQKRINTIDKTLQRQIDKGLDPSQTLIERKKKLEELIQKENDERGEIIRKTTDERGAQFKETGYADPGVDAEENQPTNNNNNQASAPQKATETASYSNESAYEQASGGGGQDSGNQSTTSSPTNVGNPFGY